MGSITRTLANNLTSSQGVDTNNFRNIIINGDCSIAIRGTSTSGISGDGYYTCDRWNVGAGSFGTWTQTQETDVPSGQGFTNSIKMDCTTAQASPAGSSLIYLEHAIEGQHLQRIQQGTANAQPTTLSFWHKHTKTGTNIVELLDADNSNAVSGSYTQSVSDTWEYSTITFPAGTSGTFDNDINRSLRIRIIIGSGSDYTSGTLATTWQTTITSADRYVGQVNNADSTSNNFQITGLQYEVGSTATDFEFLPREIQEARCARYFQRIGGSMGQYRFMPSTGMSWSGAAHLATLYLPFPMRTQATTSYSGTWTLSGTSADEAGSTPGATLQTMDAGFSSSFPSNYPYRFSWVTTGGSAGKGILIYTDANSPTLQFSAEL